MEENSIKSRPSIRVISSMIIMGSGQIFYGQIIKGLLYLAVLAATIFYMIKMGANDIVGFFTLGTVKADPWLGTKGDDSVIMMLRGILAFIILAGVVLIHISNI